LFFTFPTRALTGQHVIASDGYGARRALSSCGSDGSSPSQAGHASRPMTAVRGTAQSDAGAWVLNAAISLYFRGCAARERVRCAVQANHRSGQIVGPVPVPCPVTARPRAPGTRRQPPGPWIRRSDGDYWSWASNPWFNPATENLEIAPGLDPGPHPVTLLADRVRPSEGRDPTAVSAPRWERRIGRQNRVPCAGDESSPMNRCGAGVATLSVVGRPKCAFSDWHWPGCSL
jgi:hypothetical protein